MRTMNDLNLMDCNVASIKILTHIKEAYQSPCKVPTKYFSIIVSDLLTRFQTHYNNQVMRSVMTHNSMKTDAFDIDNFLTSEGKKYYLDVLNWVKDNLDNFEVEDPNLKKYTKLFRTILPILMNTFTEQPKVQAIDFEDINNILKNNIVDGIEMVHDNFLYTAGEALTDEVKRKLLTIKESLKERVISLFNDFTIENTNFRKENVVTSLQMMTNKIKDIFFIC